MHPDHSRKLVIFFFIMFFSFAWSLSAEFVKYVIDGDTCILGNEQRVRMLGIDAPEIDNVKYNRLGEFFGEESRIILKQWIEGEDVRLVDGPVAFDKYGRRLAYIYLGELLVNREMVKLGYAAAIRAFPYDRKEVFIRLEAEARQAALGMWQNRPAKQSQSRIPWGAALLTIFVLPFAWRMLRGGKWS